MPAIESEALAYFTIVTCLAVEGGFEILGDAE
jgi:hypothetical protein